MPTGNPYDALRALDEDVLQEAVREGEIRLEAQLHIATAADQRALTLAGFQIAAGTGSLAGGVALIMAEPSSQVLAVIALLFALAVLISSGIALWTVVPRKFKTPGNQPLNWRKNRWRWQDQGFDIKAARVEQAACLEENIKANQEHFEWAACHMRRAFFLTVASAVLAAIALIVVLFTQP